MTEIYCPEEHDGTGNPPAGQKELAELDPRTYVPGPLQLADPAVPTAVWEQQGPQGAGVFGDQPHKAVAVGVVGTAAVRETPPLDAAAGIININTGDVVRLVGRAPQRRRVIIASPTNVILATSQQQAQQQMGLQYFDADPPLTLYYAGEIWVYAVSTGTISFWAELDQG